MFRSMHGGLKSVAVVAVVGIVATAIILVGYIGFQRTLGKEIRETRIEITRQTNQYIDSKQTLLLSLLTEYNADGTTETQREALAARACAESTKISEEFIPRGMATMLNDGGCK